MADMSIADYKKSFDFLSDRLYQTGYESGWAACLEELELRADAEWNMGNGVTADIIRKMARGLRTGHDN